MRHEPFTHENQGDVQVLVVHLDEVFVILVHLPLVLAMEPVTALLAMDGNNGAKVRFNASSILKQVISSTRPESKQGTHISMCSSSRSPALSLSLRARSSGKGDGGWWRTTDTHDWISRRQWRVGRRCSKKKESLYRMG